MNRDYGSHLQAIARLVPLVLERSSVPVGRVSEDIAASDSFRTGRQALLDRSEKNQGPMAMEMCHERQLIINAESRDDHGMVQS